MRDHRNDIFLSFHGSEKLDMIVGKPTMRQFVKCELLPAIHEKWDKFCPMTKLVVFFDDYCVKEEISDELAAGIYCLQDSLGSFIHWHMTVFCTNRAIEMKV